MQKEWMELTERWKKHLIRQSVRQAMVRCRKGLVYEDIDHGLLVRPMEGNGDRWLIKAPGRETWQATVSTRGRIIVHVV